MNRSIQSSMAGTISEVIRFDQVSVNYRSPTEKIGTFKEFALNWIRGKVKHASFLALDNVSLTINKGETFGLVGYNGAGKSTLLKLVARVIRPTTGVVRVAGHVSPLLELGAGFHPELTGRENIFLNGAILGFTRLEMERKFDRIVDFAELWDFIDAPTRTYSSGMWARLGFAVATDDKPEILIVDELLSVGDESFARKSSERIQLFREQGVTILLVSHSLGLIESMCHRAAWLDHGKVMAVDNSTDVISMYRQYDALKAAKDFKSNTEEVEEKSRRWGSRDVEITAVRICDESGCLKEVFEPGDSMIIEMDFLAKEAIDHPVFGIAIHRQDGVHITGPNTEFSDMKLGKITGAGTIRYVVPGLPMLDGLFWISSAVVSKTNEVFDFHDRLYPFRVLNTGKKIKERYGLVTLGGHWEHSQEKVLHE